MLKNKAQAAADTWAAANFAGVTTSPITLTCASATSLTVDYGTSGQTSQVFGQRATRAGTARAPV